MKMLAAIPLLVLWAATPAIAQDIEPMRRVFETRAVMITVEAGSECSPLHGDKCDQAGSAVILGLQGNTALLATAAHVLDPLYAGGAPSFSQLELRWPQRPASCGATLAPLAIWRPDPIQDADDDITFIAARSECGELLEIVPNAWGNGEPSLGVTLHYIELYSPFGPHRLSSPIYLSDACILARTCFDRGLVRLQGRIEGRGSGSAFFSADGLVGIAIKTGALIAAPRINEVLDACAAGNCARNGSAIDLAPWSRKYEETLQPPKPYAEAGFHEDVAFVAAYLDGLPPDVLERSAESGCQTDEQRKWTQIEIAAGRLKVTKREVINREHCPSLPDLSGNRVRECSARLDSLNSAIRIWSGPTLGVLCRDDYCYSCTYKYDAEVGGHEDVREREAYDSDEFEFSLTDSTYFFNGGFQPREDRVRDLYRYTRALARIISGGSDKEFCLYSPPYCRED